MVMVEVCHFLVYTDLRVLKVLSLTDRLVQAVRCEGKVVASGQPLAIMGDLVSSQCRFPAWRSVLVCGLI